MHRHVSKYEAYPFLSEISLVCDYEVLTDYYASEMNLIYGRLKEEDRICVKKIAELIYHANPCVRNACTITEEDMDCLLQMMEQYNQYTPHFFVLPVDTNEVSGACQMLRAKAKQVVRLLYKIEEQEQRAIDQKIFDVFHMISQIMFGLSMKYADHVEEFVSRTY